MLTILGRKIYLHLTDSCEPMSCRFLLFGSGATCMPQHQPAKMAIDKSPDLNDIYQRFRFYAASEILPELHLQLLDGAAVRQKEVTHSTSDHQFLRFSLHNWDWKTFSTKAEPNQKLSNQNNILHCLN